MLKSSQIPIRFFNVMSLSCLCALEPGYARALAAEQIEMRYYPSSERLQARLGAVAGDVRAIMVLLNSERITSLRPWPAAPPITFKLAAALAAACNSKEIARDHKRSV